MLNKLLNTLQNKTFILTGVLILTIIGLYLRFERRMIYPLIQDELYVVAALTRYDSFATLLNKLPRQEFSSYISGDYYLLYPFVKLLGDNKWCIAIPHIIATLLCFYFLYKVCQLHLKNAIGFFVAFAIVSFNSTLIEHSFEIRYYAVLQTLGLATYYYSYLLAYRPRPLSTLKLIAMGLFFCLAILFHPYNIIVVSTHIAFFLAIHIHDKSFMNILRKITPFFAPIFLITIPILYIVLFVWPHITSEIWGNNTFQFIPNPMDNPIGFLKGIFCNLIGYKPFYAIIAGLILSLSFSHQDRDKQIWFFLLLIILPIGLLFSLDLKYGYWFIQRQFIWVIPLFAVLLAWSWESLIRHLTKR